MRNQWNRRWPESFGGETRQGEHQNGRQTAKTNCDVKHDLSFVRVSNGTRRFSRRHDTFTGHPA